MPDRELHDLWDAARHEAGQVALFGDLVLAAFFEAKEPGNGRNCEVATPSKS